MEIIQEIAQYIENNTRIGKDYIELILLTILLFLLYKIVKIVTRKIYYFLPMNDKNKFYRNRNAQIVITIILIIIIFLMWGEKLQGLITIVSFISAGIAIAIREIIFNFFAGVYLKFRKTFEVEDRIEINGIKGDVINVHALGFEILEVGGRIEGEQSTGRIVHIPNSYIFKYTVKNYTKAFKYIWDEITVKVTLTADIKKTQEILYNILFDNEDLREIPIKMENAVDDIILEYRIYYNNFDPIIYTKIVDSHVELYLRYLVHPKKARNVQDEINLKILEQYQEGNIALYEES